MKKKGLSLIEVVIAMVLITLIMVSFSRFASVMFSTLNRTSTFIYDKMAVQKLLNDEVASLKKDTAYTVVGNADYNITAKDNAIAKNEFKALGTLTYVAEDKTTRKVSVSDLSFKYKMLKVEPKNADRSNANLYYLVGDYKIKIPPLPRLKRVWIDTYDTSGLITSWNWKTFIDTLSGLQMYTNPKVSVSKLITKSGGQELYGKAEVYSDPDLTDEFYTDNLLIKQFEWVKTKTITYNIPKDNFSDNENKNYAALWPNFENDFVKIAGEDNDQLSSTGGLANHFVSVKVTPVSKYYTFGDAIYSMPLYIDPDFLKDAALYLNASRINVKNNTDAVGEVGNRTLKNWKDLSANNISYTVTGAPILKQPSDLFNPYMYSRYTRFTQDDTIKYALTADNSEEYQVFYVARGEENTSKVLTYISKQGDSSLPIEDQLNEDMQVIDGYAYVKLQKGKVPDDINTYPGRDVWYYDVLGKKYYLTKVEIPVKDIAAGQRHDVSHIDGRTLIGVFRYLPSYLPIVRPRRLQVDIIQASSGTYYAKFISEISERDDNFYNDGGGFEKRRLYWDSRANNWFVRRRRRGIKYMNPDLEGITNLDNYLYKRMYFKAGSRFYSIDKNGGIIYKEDGKYYFTYSFAYVPEMPKIKDVLLAGSKVNIKQYPITAAPEKPWVVGHATIKPKDVVSLGNNAIDLAEMMIFKGPMEADKKRQILDVLKQKYLPAYDITLVESVESFEETFKQNSAYSLPVSAPALYQGGLKGMAEVEFDALLDTKAVGQYTLTGHLRKDKTKTFTYTLNVIAP